MANFDRDGLEFLASRMDDKARRETGWAKGEALRCAEAVRAFQETFALPAFKRYKFTAPPKGLFKTVAGVKMNITLNAGITQEKDGATFSGGLVLKYAFGADRLRISSQLSNAAGLILWGLEGGQMEPLSRLCMAVDLAERNPVKASKSYERFRARVTESCKEISARWDDIEPPHDYDGPDWR
ncbi:MAG: hypothetical protein AAGH90_10780 [Pseudomonadota bacterium]